MFVEIWTLLLRSLWNCAKRAVLFVPVENLSSHSSLLLMVHGRSQLLLFTIRALLRAKIK